MCVCVFMFTRLHPKSQNVYLDIVYLFMYTCAAAAAAVSDAGLCGEKGVVYYYSYTTILLESFYNLIYRM